MKVGILALQGDVPEHRAMLEGLLPKEEIALVHAPADLAGVSGLLMPGGESTTMGRLLRSSGLFEPLRERIQTGLPVLATCAGLVLLSGELAPGAAGEEPETIHALNILLRRNDYGRQAESFEAPVRLAWLPGPEFRGVFIRAPRILQVGPGVEPLAFRGEEVVGVKSGAVWAFAFHPELSGDPRVHRSWLATFRPSLAAQPRSSKSSARTSHRTRSAVPNRTRRR